MRAYKCIASLVLVATGAGCRTPAKLPYDYAAVPTRPTPAHPLRVAILPLEDAREAREAPDPRGLYTYSGVLYAGTRLEALGDLPGVHVAEVLARHLARARVFAQVILVLKPEQAPEADLLLEGRIRRARGYVEAAAPPEGSGRTEAERAVLAEVVLEDLRLRPREGPARLELDVGWSIAETRALDAEGRPPEPWAVMSEAMQVALTDLVTVIEGADLSGGFVARPKVRLPKTTTASAAGAFGALAEQPPEGWRVAATSSAARPRGWRGDANCAALRLEARQTRRFSRTLGPYTPSVEVWACPAAARLSFDGRADLPARLLGNKGGRWYFSLALGRTNWPDAEAEIAAHLRLEPPPRRYLFEVGPGSPPAVDEPPLRLDPSRRAPLRKVN